MGVKHYIEEHQGQLNGVQLLEISKLLGKVIDNHVEDHVDKIIRKIAGIKNNYRFDKETAEEVVSKMYYDENGKKFAPYWEFDVVKDIYLSYKKQEPVLENYNEYDFYVTLNMIKSDNYKLYKKRFSGYSDNQLDKLFIEDAINWLDDKDNPFGENKIWKYFNN